MSDATHESQPRVFKRRVFFTGSTEILQGQGFCYERDYANANKDGHTTTDPCGYRDKRVELPSKDSNDAFAGVAAQSYSASPVGQWIDIYEPGSVCPVLVGMAATVAGTLLTCSMNTADAGWFTRAGFVGRGTVRALQTIASHASNIAPLMFKAGATVTNAANGVITATGLCGNVKAGDRVVVLAGARTTDASNVVTPGVYTVTAADANTMTVAGQVATQAATITCYAVRGAPTILAELLDGPQSGLQDTCAVIGNGAEPVPVPAATGMTYLVGGTTVGTADGKATMASAASKLCSKKGYFLDGALTTNDLMVTEHADDKLVSAAGAAINTVELDADTECAFFEWFGDKWVMQGGLGTVA